MSAPSGFEIVLARHGATEWSRAGKHTGRTDIPLTDVGREQARRLGRALAGRRFVAVWTSPLVRAAETSALAGFPSATVDADLQEWNYGQLDGLTTAEIRTTRPGWTIWSGEVPGGETADQVAARADRVIGRVVAAHGETLLFAHGHFLRVFCARWLGLGPESGRLFTLDTATISTLGFEREQRVVRNWNVPT
jgi:probable phosphoglycerate mutase